MPAVLRLTVTIGFSYNVRTKACTVYCKYEYVLKIYMFVQEEGTSFKMINIAGVISIVLFYVLILAVGIWAGRKKPAGNDSEEEVMLAGRSIGLFVGIFTMTGEWTPLEYTSLMISSDSF